jgi:hypothetical protein
VHLLQITLEQWRAIRSAGKRAEVLQAAEKSPEALRELVESLTHETNGRCLVSKSDTGRELPPD